MTRLWQRLLAYLRRAFAPPSPAPVNPGGGSSPPLVPDNPVPPAPPDAGAGDDLDLARVKKIIVNNSPPLTEARVRSAPVSVTLKSVWCDGNNVHMDTTPYEGPFGKVVPIANAICYLFYIRGGEPFGGKFDWMKPYPKGLVKDLKNPKAGKYGHVMPQKGDPCWVMVSDCYGDWRSNTRRVTWR